MLPIYKPYISNYKKSALNAIDSEWISNYGIYVENAENKLKDIFDIKYCILMNNGTAATHCLFLALKFKYPNINKIYVPNNTFVAGWNCVLMEYDKKQLEVMKINPETFNIDTSEEYIKSLDQNSCVLIIHNLGNIVNVPRLKRIRPDIIFVEDNCEGFTGRYEDTYSGMTTSSLCSSISFYGNKILTTGEGGAFFTHNKDVYDYIKSIYSHGMTNVRYIHKYLAYNYRMTNIQAAFLYDQLNDLEHILKIKKEIFELYDKLLEKLFSDKKVVKLKNEKYTRPANWMYCILIPNVKYEVIEKHMNDKNIQIRPFFYDIRNHKHLKDIKVLNDEIKNTKHGLMLPSYPNLKRDEQLYIINCLNEYVSLHP